VTSGVRLDGYISPFAISIDLEGNMSRDKAFHRPKRGGSVIAEPLETRLCLSLAFGPLITTSLPQTYSAGSLIFSGDFNNAGETDLLLSPANPQSTSQILWGTQNGSFSAITNGPTAPAGFNFSVVDAVGDVNGDGKADIIQIATKQVSATSFSTEITSYISQGNRTFIASAHTFVPSGGAPVSPDPMAIADFNSDGKADLFLAFATDTIGHVEFVSMIGNGDGTFTVGQTFFANLGSGASDVQLFAGNFFGDGRTDVAAVSPIPGTPRIEVFANDGDDTFTQVERQLNLTNQGVPVVTAGDFTGDGLTDLAFASTSVGTGVPTEAIQVFLNQGLAVFSAKAPISESQPIDQLATGDFTNDGRDDLLVSTGFTFAGGSLNTALVYQSNSDGSFQPVVTAISNSTVASHGYSAVDLKANGIADVVAIGINIGLHGTSNVEDVVNTAAGPGQSGSVGPAASSDLADPGELVGSVDSANMNEIQGWADDPSDPSAPVQVEVQISGGPTQTFMANEPRSDLQDVLGSSDHAFTYATPMLSVGNHTASIYAIMTDGEKVLIGTATLTSQNSLFDEHYYLEMNPDVAAAVSAGIFATGYDHYVEYGQYEGRSPSPFWDEAYYLQQNPDVAAAVKAGTVTSGFMQYYLYGQYENRGGLLYFDSSYYLQNNSDVAAAVGAGTITSAYEHFVLYGQYEGRNPIPYFSTAVYEADNPSIVSEISGDPYMSAYDQFVEQGQYEGLVASNFYNEQTYLADNPDVAAAVDAGIFSDGFQHWLEYGQFEGRTAV
jgi:hypothetical protein